MYALRRDVVARARSRACGTACPRRERDPPPRQATPPARPARRRGRLPRGPFQNLLDAAAEPRPAPAGFNLPSGRTTRWRAAGPASTPRGSQLVTTIGDDASFVGSERLEPGRPGRQDHLQLLRPARGHLPRHQPRRRLRERRRGRKQRQRHVRRRERGAPRRATSTGARSPRRRSGWPSTSGTSPRARARPATPAVDTPSSTTRPVTRRPSPRPRSRAPSPAPTPRPALPQSRSRRIPPRSAPPSRPGAPELVPVAGCGLTAETFAYATSATGFDLTGTGTPNIATSADVLAERRRSCPRRRNPTKQSAPSPPPAS